MRRIQIMAVTLLVLSVGACDDEPGPTESIIEVEPTFASAAGGGTTVASVRGSGHVFQGEGERRTFSFAARQAADSSVSGQFSLVITEPVFGSTNPTITRLEADVTCMTMGQGIAWVGGVVTNASNPDWIGKETGWVVQDGGEGRDSYDAFSLMDVPADGLAQRMCQTRYRFPGLPVEQGNIQISNGGPMNDNFFPFSVVMPVCGEWTAFAGSFHTVFRFTDDGAGGYHMKGHYNATGIGVGLSSDAVYNWNDAINYSTSFQGQSYVANDQQSFLLLGRGQTPDERMHFNAHINVTPGGVVNFTAHDVRVSCDDPGPA